MDYDEALKKINSKHKENFIVVTTSYNKLVLPYADGMALMLAIKNAEQFDDTYNPKRILPMDVGVFTFTILPAQEYEQFKLAALLNITIEQAKEMHPLNPKLPTE